MARRAGDTEISADHVLDQMLKGTVQGFRVYQFHNTTSNASIRRPIYMDDNQELLADGGNLAAMLYRHEQANSPIYHRMIRVIRHIFPQFDSFVLKPEPHHPNIRLNWREIGSDHLFGPHQLSDGTLRAMALVTLLLQPEHELPPVLILDEPELGLHPYAIGILAGLLEGASANCQAIVATQSLELISHFSPEDIISFDCFGKRRAAMSTSQR